MDNPLFVNPKLKKNQLFLIKHHFLTKKVPCITKISIFIVKYYEVFYIKQ